MEENKDMMKDDNQTVTFEEVEDKAAAESEPTKNDAATADKPKKEKKKPEWLSKPVTGKVLAIGLGIAVLVNAALTAGISAIFGNSHKHDMQGNGRPGSEMMGGPGGQMSPPGDMNGGQQGQQGQAGQSQSSGPSIGITVKDDSGAVIAQVTGDNAKKAGFQEGDKVTKVDGTAVSSSSELVSAVKSHKSGDTVTVTVERDGQSMEIKTVLE